MDFIDMHINKIIKDIIDGIQEYDIDVVELCDRVCIEPNEFINILNNPRKNISLYLGILEEVQHGKS